ncbi:MAG: response regulator [Steroidobacteraceae bacterium]
MRRKNNILIVDQAGITRDGLCALLEREDEMEVIGVARDATEAAGAVLASDPHVEILDFSISDGCGPEAVAALKRRWPEARVLVLTSRNEEQLIQRALRAGVDGYLLKSDDRQELMTAIRAVAENKRYISPSIFDRVVNGYVRKHPSSRQVSEDGLSNREREVMKLIALGYRTREIAEQLSLSHKTIEKHRSTLMRKLGLRTATAVVAYAIGHRYLEP